MAKPGTDQSAGAAPDPASEQKKNRSAKPGKLAALDDAAIDAIIARIAKGEYQSHIAREFDVTPQGFHQRLSKHPDYKAAVEARNRAKLDNKEKDIERADNSLSLARAREGFKAASWRAERESPGTWGNKVDVTSGNEPLKAPADPTAALIEAARNIAFVMASGARLVEGQTITAEHARIEEKP
jgi:hypothetical protein